MTYMYLKFKIALKSCCVNILVLGAIGVCLFPLWPPEVRLGVYYISLAAAAFVGFILVLTISKYLQYVSELSASTTCIRR